MVPRKPKILIFDIETSNLSANLGFMIAFAWKWLGGKTKYKTVLDYPNGKKFDPVYADRLLCEHVREVLNSADMWVTWYGALHDVPFLRSRFLLNNLKTFADAAHFDGWKVAIKRLKFSRNGLNTFYNSLSSNPTEIKADKCPVHIHHWIRAATGDLNAIREVSKKGKNDVNKLELVFDKLKPFAGELLPNLTYTEGNLGWRAICTVCYSINVRKWGTRFKDDTLKQRWQCHGCGSYFYGKLENEK